MNPRSLPLLAACALAAFGGAARANLLVNGGFEASSSYYTTPPGWFNIGETEGVLGYSNVQTQPVYEGLEFYDIGGVASNGYASIGDGIAQTFATTPGASYVLSFAYTAENVPGVATETLRASAGSSFKDYALVPNGDPVFTRPWSTDSIGFVASGTSTTISFTLVASTGPLGNNDPMIDGVSVVMTAVPEAQSSAMMLAGLGGLIGFAGLRRRRRT